MNNFILTNQQMADKTIAELKVGDDIVCFPSTPIGGTKITRGKIEAIYRDHEGNRVFDLGGDYRLIPAIKLLLPDWVDVAAMFPESRSSPPAVPGPAEPPPPGVRAI